MSTEQFDEPDYAQHANDQRELPRVHWGQTHYDPSALDPRWSSGTPAPKIVITWDDIPRYNVMHGRWNVFDKTNSPFAHLSDESYMQCAQQFAQVWAAEDEALAAPRKAAEAAMERRRQSNRDAQTRFRQKKAQEQTAHITVVTDADVLAAAAAVAAAESQRAEAMAQMAANRAAWNNYVSDVKRVHRALLARKPNPV